MYNLNESSNNYSKTSGSLRNYYRAEPNKGVGEHDINYSIDYKASITGKFENNDTTKDVQIAVPLKYLSRFWRTLDIPLISC